MYGITEPSAIFFYFLDLVNSRCFCPYTPIWTSSGAPLNKPFLVLGQCDWVELTLIPPLFLVAKWACDSGLPNKHLPSSWIQYLVQGWPPNGLIWLSPGVFAGLMIWRSPFSLEITRDKEDRILELTGNKANIRGGRTVQKQNENSLHHSRTWMRSHLKSRPWTLRLESKTEAPFCCISESSKQKNLKQYNWLNYVFWNYIYLPWIAPMYI